MRILLMDGLQPAIEGIEQYLPDWKMDFAPDPEALRLAVKLDSYACIVLDITAMEGHLREFINEIRHSGKHAGLVVISGRNSLKEKIEALTTGADDFLVKPFEVSELAARIIALARRVGSLSREDLLYKEIRISVDGKLVFVNEQEIDLTKKELQLLQYFIEHKNNVVKKESLVSFLSGNSADFNGNVDIIYAHVKNLKRKLTHAGCRPYLKTIYGIGYKWEDS